MHNQTQATGQMGSANSLFVPDPAAQWWPPELGAPSATGSQNNVRYAYFSDSHRLAVTTGGKAWVYDTLDHRIGGFGQQQGGGQSITFTSQYGTVNLSTLPVVSRDGVAVQPIPFQSISGQAPMQAPPMQAPLPANHPPVEAKSMQSSPTQTRHSTHATGDDIIATLERLGQLMEKGYITKEEFATKKSELLNRL